MYTQIKGRANIQIRPLVHTIISIKFEPVISIRSEAASLNPPNTLFANREAEKKKRERETKRRRREREVCHYS